MEENKKGAFLSKVEDFAKEMSEMISEREDVERGLIVLALEDVKDEDDTDLRTYVYGNRGKIAELVAQFAIQDETRPIVSQGLKLVAMKTLIEKIRGEASNN